MKHQPLKPLYLSSFVTVDETPAAPAVRQLPANIKQLKRVYRQLLEFNEPPVRFNWNKLRGVGIALLILAGLESLPQAQTLIDTPKPPVYKQVSDTDRSRSSKQPVAFSDDTVSIGFHNCRENDKHHWSCQRVDGDDTGHYVYIPGFKPQTQRANPLAGASEKGGKR